MSARGSGEKPSIVVLHSINFEESWTKQTYLDIERKFGEEGFTVKAIPLQIPGIRTMEGFQEKRTMILERVPVFCLYVLQGKDWGDGETIGHFLDVID